MLASTMKPRIFLLAVAILLAALWVAMPRPVPAPCPVDVRPETGAKLQLGMHEREVVALLGAPAGDYRINKDRGYLDTVDGPLPGPDKAVEKQWLTDDCMILVWFARDDGKTVCFHWVPVPPPPSWFESLMNDLRLYLPFFP
jgi:hypothetical protein